jgi:hypothetical protein
MRSLTAIVCLLALGAAASASSARAYTYWNDIRHSALLPDSAVAVRLENPTGAGVANYIIYANAGSEVLEATMDAVADGPSTVAAEVPGPVAASKYYGFRLLQGEELDLMPMRLADGADPEPSHLTRLAEDPAGDHLYGYVNLDLVECRLSFSGERLYAALKNAGGGFPVSSGLTFFGYLLAIADPALSDPDTVFALMHTYNQPGIITPGLYKITGSGLDDLVKIGEVEVEQFPALNTLVISCELADLMSDPYFLSWYDPTDRAIGVAAFTQRITLLGGAKESDRSPGGTCHLREFAIAPEINQLPELSDFGLGGSGAGAFAEIDYLDANGNCPILAEMVFDDTLSYALRPAGLDYGGTVTYRTDAGIAPLADDSWTSALLRFSDDAANWVEYVPCTNGVPDGPAGSGLGVLLSPNPSRESAAIELVMPAPGDLRLEIYDTRGRLVRTLIDGQMTSGPVRLEWNGQDDSGRRTSPGVYVCRVSVAGQEDTRKMVLIK